MTTPDTAATCPTTGLPMEQCTTTLGQHRHPTTRLFRANGTDMDVCQDHVAKAVGGVLTVPRLHDLTTGQEVAITVVTITVTWHIT